MGEQALRKVEHTLVELKAKVDDLDFLRKKLSALKARHVGTFRQIDVYFDTPKGRLKLRETEGDHRAELVYYERENIAGPKRSKVFILKIEEPARFKMLLEKVLKTIAIVDKTREIYEYQGTKIHLDRVKALGTFVEFERETSTDSHSIRKNQQVLEELMEKLEINRESLRELSYGDLVKNRVNRKG